MTSLVPFRLAGLFSVSSAGTCDLPVGRVPHQTLPNEKSREDTWATAYGVSPSEWSSIAAESDALELRSLLEKGYTDWASDLLADRSISLSRKARRNLGSLRALTRAVFTSSSLGEVFGNRELVEASSLYHLLGLGDDLGTLHQDMAVLWMLHSRLGILSKHRKTCIKLLYHFVQSEDLNTEELCRCERLWVCGDENALVRVTLSNPGKVMDYPDEALDFSRVLRGVRILEFQSGKLFDKGILGSLLGFFPNARVMTVHMQEEPMDMMALNSWTASIVGLDLRIASTVVPDWICEFRDLRHLHISGDSNQGGQHVSIKALPGCLGNFSELIHLNVIGCNLTGTASLPESMGNLQKLRIFEAFENGRLSEEKVSCPGEWLPNRSLVKKRVQGVGFKVN